VVYDHGLTSSMLTIFAMFFNFWGTVWGTNQTHTGERDRHCQGR
jgi:hypothetical protein